MSRQAFCCVVLNIHISCFFVMLPHIWDLKTLRFQHEPRLITLSPKDSWLGFPQRLSSNVFHLITIVVTWFYNDKDLYFVSITALYNIPVFYFYLL